MTHISVRNRALVTLAVAALVAAGLLVGIVVVRGTAAPATVHEGVRTTPHVHPLVAVLGMRRLGGPAGPSACASAPGLRRSPTCRDPACAATATPAPIDPCNDDDGLPVINSPLDTW